MEIGRFSTTYQDLGSYIYPQPPSGKEKKAVDSV
jgi:hypothetical protein